MLTVTLLVCAMMALATADHHQQNGCSHVLQKGTSGNDEHVEQTNHTADLNRTADCKSGWVLFGSRCFQFVPTQMTWAKAQQNCLSNDATLASIHTAEEHQFIQGLTTASKLPAWVGLAACQEEYSWFWTDSTLLQYTSWCPGQPDGKIPECCMQINTGGGKCWDDVPCHTENPSVCVLK